jgi:threonine/homoserine/homoserine lactone efflux protein
LGPVWGGFLISMSNPYWWVWWASIGFAFMLRYGISFSSWPLLAAFFIGHEAGDFAWYIAVSSLVYLGRKRINDRIYRIVLILCAVVMIGLGAYLGVSAFSYEPQG